MSLIVISKVSPFENVDVVPEGEPFTLTNTYLKAHFSDQGLLQVSTKHIRKYCAKLSIFQLSVHSQHNIYDVFSFSKGITTTEDNVKTETMIEFVQYGTRSRGDKSGAYLFLPGTEQ